MKGEIMKFLLVVTGAMLLTGSAFGACTKESTKDCKESECKDINYVWTKGAPVQCMSPDGPVATNCPAGNEGSRGNDTPTNTPSGNTTPTTGTGR